MTAPERYTFMDPDQYADLQGEGGPVIAEPDWSGKAVEYVRADLYTAQQETIAALVEAAYLAGFKASAEGWNGEYPFQDSNASPTTDADWIKMRDEDLAALGEGE